MPRIPRQAGFGTATLGMVLLSWVVGAAGLRAFDWETGPGFRRRHLVPGGGIAGRSSGFTLMEPARTGVWFTNQLTGDAFLTNFVAHNGSGVALADVDRDGLLDVYLCSLEGPNRLYRNRGAWRFEEASLGEAACADQFSSGAAFADVDGDADPDLLVNGIGSGTRLFLNDGKGVLTEAKDCGLSRTASAMSLSLADIDGDGDLDLYVTHYIDVMHLADPTTRFALSKRGDQWVVLKVNGEPATRPRWKDRFEVLADGSVRELPEADGLYRNDGGGRFTSILTAPGVFSGASGEPKPPPREWGLAAMFRDLNGDGAPDLVVCNDNASPDRFWMNSGKGTFREIDPLKIRHSSRSSMALDVADVDRDGRDDILITDMLARERSRRMRQLVRDRPDPAEAAQIAARPRFNRNMLFLGRADGSYAETALMAGIAATDWSWCPLFLDVDLDGFEDLLVMNGFDMDVMDQDSHDRLQVALRTMRTADRKRSRQIHPGFRTANAGFRNRRDGTFEAVSDAWGIGQVGVSQGAAVGDLDQDGDLDLVVNNLNGVAGLYRNDAIAPRIAVRLRGAPPNTAGIGARVSLISPTLTQSQEINAGGRYLSGDEPVRVFAAAADSGASLRLVVHWRDGRVSSVDHAEANWCYEIDQAGSEAPVVESTAGSSREPVFQDVSGLIDHRHRESAFDEQAQQPLLPRATGRRGPGLAWVDLDGDGWEDMVVGAARGEVPAFFRNQDGRAFLNRPNAAPAGGDQTAVVGWTDGAGRRGLLAAVSNEELPPGTQSELARYTVPDLASPERQAIGLEAAGPLAVADVDGDGDLDLFVGGRSRPGRYPEPAPSRVLINDQGRLRPSEDLSRPFSGAGLISGATFFDADQDGDPDLALACEWGPVRVFLNEQGRFVEGTSDWGLSAYTGRWNGLAAGDFDGDGLLDLAVANWGRNSTYELIRPGPVRVYYGDGDGDGNLEVVEASGVGQDWHPIRNRLDLATEFPDLGQRLPTHERFANASVAEIIGRPLSEARFVEAAHWESTVFLNRGSRFEASILPIEAQRAPAFSVNVGDFDGDGREDLFLSQNSFGPASEFSRDDAGRGLCLLGLGDGTFRAMDDRETGIAIDGEQRGAALADFNHDGRVDLAVAQNNEATRLYLNQGARQGLRVRLAGPVANPDGVGAVLRLVYADGRQGPSRSVQAGSGYGSQEGAAQVLGTDPERKPTGLWIRWPGGREQIVPLAPGQWHLTIADDEP